MDDSVERAVSSFLGEDKIEWEKLKPVMCFVVLWNRLEAKCGFRLSLQGLKAKSSVVASSDSFDVARYEPHITFFRKRYSAQPSLLETLFRHGNDREKPSEESLCRLIQGDAMTAQDSLGAILFIPYRIRNNLFHGTKETSQLYAQTQLFEHVSHVLCLFHSDLG